MHGPVARPAARGAPSRMLLSYTGRNPLVAIVQATRGELSELETAAFSSCTAPVYERRKQREQQGGMRGGGPCFDLQHVFDCRCLAPLG